jgi:hypothetical protein
MAQLSCGVLNESRNIPMWDTELSLDEIETMSKLGTLIMCACHQLTLNIALAVFGNHWIALVHYREWNIRVT